jgi:D-tyrosyl-tRNA(Tyr) deacylase
MRVVLQRVSRAAVSVDGEVVAGIGPGFLLLVGAGREDLEDEPERLADKIANLRVFAEAEGKMNLALADVGGEVLVVDPGPAAERVEAFARALEARGLKVGRGVFGAHMEVDLVNDGPVTLVLDGAGL